MVNKLEKMWLLCIPVLLIMILCSEFFFKVWLGESVNIPMSLSVSISLYMLFQILGNIYMYMINGTSKVRIQMIIYILFSFVSIPLISYFAKNIGLEGIVLIPSIIYLIQGILGRIQIRKLINGTAKGIWLK